MSLPAADAPVPPSAVQPTALNPNALDVAQAARLLTAGGRAPVTDAMIRADLDAGAPANSDGTLNLVHYAAWLVAESSRHDPGRNP